jgi:hypothetical protein
MNKKDHNFDIRVTSFEAILFLAFLIIPWCIGMLDVFNSFWDIVLR